MRPALGWDGGAAGARRFQEVEDAYWYAVEHEEWPEGFDAFNAIRDLIEYVRRYRESLIAHHDIANMSEEAIRKGLGYGCGVCRDAKRGVRSGEGQDAVCTCGHRRRDHGGAGNQGWCLAASFCECSAFAAAAERDPCMRCGFDEWTWCDYRGCSGCRENGDTDETAVRTEVDVRSPLAPDQHTSAAEPPVPPGMGVPRLPQADAQEPDAAAADLPAPGGTSAGTPRPVRGDPAAVTNHEHRVTRRLSTNNDGRCNLCGEPAADGLSDAKGLWCEFHGRIRVAVALERACFDALTTFGRGLLDATIQGVRDHDGTPDNRSQR